MKIFQPLVMLKKFLSIVPFITPFEPANSDNNVPSVISNNTDLSKATFIKNIGIAPYYSLNNTYPNLEGDGFNAAYGALGDYKNNNDTYRNDIIEQGVELGSDFNQLFYIQPQAFKTSVANQANHNTIIECYKNGTFIPCPQSTLSASQQYILPIRDIMDLKKWGTFKIYTSPQRDLLPVKKAMHLAVTRMEEMFSKKLINAGDVTSQDCTVTIHTAAFGGESGIYSADINNCIINAVLSMSSNYKILVHEMFHALFNGFLRGKTSSMPSMFSEGWACVAGHNTDFGNNQDVLNTITSLMLNQDIKSLSNLFEVLKSYYPYNYLLGQYYFYFCMNTSPDTLLRYVNKIKLIPEIPYLTTHADQLTGVYSLGKECSLFNFESWLHNPNYTIPDPNLTIEEQHRYDDIILEYVNGVPKVFRCTQKSQIHMPENVSSKSCHDAYDIMAFVKDRVIFRQFQDIVVITNNLGGQGITVLYKVGANIEKYFCNVTGIWLANSIKTFLYESGNNELTKIANYVKQCNSQLPTSEDMAIFLVTTEATTIINTDDANQDIILICDPEQGSSSYICPAPRQQIPILEQYIKYNCSSAIGDNLTNRIISYHSFNDIQVITFQNSGVAFITRQEKYFCDNDLRNWFEQSVKQIIHNKGSNCKGTMGDIERIKKIPITICQKVSLSTSDMQLFLPFIHDDNIEDSATGSTNISLPILYGVGILGIGVVVVWMCKNTQSKNSQPIAHELTVLSSNQRTDMDLEKILEMDHARKMQNQTEEYNMRHKQWSQYNHYKHTYTKLQLQISTNEQELAQHQELNDLVLLSYNNNITPNVDLNGDANDHY